MTLNCNGITWFYFMMQLEHLDTDLKNHKANTIKESIRSLYFFVNDRTIELDYNISLATWL